MFYKMLRIGLLIILSYIPDSFQKDEIQSRIATEVRKLSLTDFNGDATVNQIIDNSVTTYKDVVQNVILKRSKNDFGKDVIVHSTDESRRNTYIVLRKSGQKDLYYINYAYLRNATAQDENSFKIGNSTQQRCIEWDSWESRKLTQENTEWLDCRASIVVSCAYNDSLVGTPKKNMFLNKHPSLDSTKSPDSSTTAVSIEEIPLISEVGFSTDYNSEFFRDIDDVNKLNGMGRSFSVSIQISSSSSSSGYEQSESRHSTRRTTFYILVNIVRTLPNGERVETKDKEFVQCTDNCKGDRYTKNCKADNCQMQLYREGGRGKGDGSGGGDDNDNTDDQNGIYFLKWGLIKTKLKDGTIKEEKIKSYRLTKIYWRDCTGKRCSMTETDSNDNLDNIKLYTVINVEEPVEDDDNFVVESVNKFRQLSNKDISNLYRKVCPKVRGQEQNDKKCHMLKLVQWIGEDDDEITTSQDNGEYKLYRMELKSEIKIESDGKRVRESINKYEPARNINYKKLFTNICKNEHCSMEPIIEDNEFTTYKIVTIKRKSPLPNGKFSKVVSRFRAVKPKTIGKLYKKYCDGEKPCIMKPYYGDTDDYVNFYKLTKDTTTKGESGIELFIYTHIRLYKIICSKNKCSHEYITNPEDTLVDDIYEEDEPSPSSLQERTKPVPLDPSVYETIYYQLCSKEICGMIPIIIEAIKYYRIVKHRRTIKYGNNEHRQVTDTQFVPTKLFKKICKGQNCTMVYLSTFDMITQERLLKSKIKLYYLTFTSKNDGKNGIKMTPDFVELDEETQNRLYSQNQNCNLDCSIKHVDNLQEHRIYIKLNATLSSDDKEGVISFEPIQLYKRVCLDPKDKSTCSMHPEVVTSEDLKKGITLYKTNDDIDGEIDYIPLDPETLDNLYRKHCEDGRCMMRPLKEDEPNVFYELETVQKDGQPAEDFKIILIFKRVCKTLKHCQMEPFILKNNTKIPKILFIREIKVTKRPIGAGGRIRDIITKTYSPIRKEQEDKIYHRICPSAILKCYMKPLYDTGLLRLIIEKINGVKTKKYVPISIYKSECDKNEINCDMTLVQPTEEHPEKYELYELDSTTVIINSTVGSFGKFTRNRRKYKRFPVQLHSKIYARVCSETGCVIKPFFNDEGEYVMLDKIIKPIEGETEQRLTPADQKYIKRIQLYKKICSELHPTKCHMKLLTKQDDPKQYELFHLVLASTDTQDGSNENIDSSITHNYEPLLTEDLPKLFKKICIANKCKLHRLFPEDENTIFKRVPSNDKESSGGLIMVFLFKKICTKSSTGEGTTKDVAPTGNEHDDCDMIPLTKQDKPRKVLLFEMISEKANIKDTEDQEKITVIKTYTPIVPELHENTYFRKICNAVLKTCVLQDLFEDKNAIYQQILTIENPQGLDDPSVDVEYETEYRPLHLYKKICKSSQNDDDEGQQQQHNCEMEYTSPDDDLTNEHLYELKIQIQNTRKVSGGSKKLNERHSYIKHYEPIPEDTKFSLYRKVCKNIDCIYTPIFEDETSIYKLIRKEKRNTTIFNTELQDQKLSEYILIQLFKNVCGTGKGSKCKMERFKSKEHLPDILYQLIVTKRIIETRDGKKREEIYTQYIHYDIEHYYKLYRKSCNENNCKMIPLRENRVYKLIKIKKKNHKQPTGNDPNEPGTGTDVDIKKDYHLVKKFIPITLYYKVCQKEHNGQIISCDMKPVIHLDEIELQNLFVLDTPEGKNKYESVSTYNPITPELIINFFKKNCTSDRSKCIMTPLIQQNVYIGKIYKIIQTDVNGVKKPDTDLDLTPIHLFKKICKPKENDIKKLVCEMKLFTSEDPPDDEGHYHLFYLTIENKSTKLHNGDIIVNLVKKYFPISSHVEDQLYRKVCENGHCFAKPVFDSTFYYWKNTTREKISPNGKVEIIFTEELIPIKLVIESCKYGKCSIQPLTWEEEDIQPPIKLLIQNKKSIIKTLPNGKEIDDTVITNVNFTTRMRHHTNIKICPPDNKPCYMKPLDETKLGILLNEFDINSKIITKIEIIQETTEPVSPEPDEVDTESLITIQPETTPDIPPVEEETTEPDVIEVITKPEPVTEIIPEITEPPESISEDWLESTTFPTEIPEDVTEEIPIPDVVKTVILTPKKKRKSRPIKIKFHRHTSPPKHMLSPVEEESEDILFNAKTVLKDKPHDGIVVGEVSHRVSVRPNVNIIELTTESPPDVTDQIDISGELEIPEVLPETTIEPEPEPETTRRHHKTTTIETDTRLVYDPSDDKDVQEVPVKESPFDTTPTNLERVDDSVGFQTFEPGTDQPITTERIPETTPPESKEIDIEITTRRHHTTTPKSSYGEVDTDVKNDDEFEYSKTTKRTTRKPSYADEETELRRKDTGIKIIGEIPVGPDDDHTSRTTRKPHTTPSPESSEEITNAPEESTTIQEELTTRFEFQQSTTPRRHHTTKADKSYEAEDQQVIRRTTTTTESTSLESAVQPDDEFTSETELPNESDEYDDSDDYPTSPDDENGPQTLIKKGSTECPDDLIFETPSKNRLIFKLLEPPVKNVINKIIGVTFETVNRRVITLDFPKIPNKRINIKWLQIVYTSPTPSKQKYIFELEGIPDDKVPIDSKNFTLNTTLGLITINVPHPSVAHGIFNIYFTLKTIIVYRGLTNFKYLRQQNDLSTFDYNQPLEVIITDIPESDDKRYIIKFRTPDDIHITFKGKKKSKKPVIIQKILFETCRNKNISTRLPLFEVHKIPFDDRWLELSYTNKDSLQEIKFPGVIKYRLKTKPNFKTPKGMVVFDLPNDEHTNIKICLLLNNGEKYNYEIPALQLNYLNTTDVRSKPKKSGRPEIPIPFTSVEGKRVVFITHSPHSSHLPFDTVQFDFELGEDNTFNVPLPGSLIPSKNGQTLVLIYTSPGESQQTHFNFPMILYNGESEVTLKTKRNGKIIIILPEDYPILTLKYYPKPGVEHTFTLGGFTIKPLEIDQTQTEQVLITEMVIETPDNLMVTFLTQDKDYIPTFRVFDIKLTTRDHEEYFIKFPAKDAPKNVKYLQLDYTPPSQNRILFQLPGLIYDSELMKPGKILEVHSAKGVLMFDFPKLEDHTRDNIRIIYTLKNSTHPSTHVYNTPFLNLAGYDTPTMHRRKKIKHRQRKNGISMYTVDGKILTIETDDTLDENSNEPLIANNLHFEVNSERNVSIKLIDKKKGKKYMQLLYSLPGEKPITIIMTGIPWIDPTFGASTFKLKSEAGIALFDIPKPTDESRSGIRIDLLLLNEEKIPYEINGLTLQGTEAMIKSTLSAQSYKYSVKTQNVFTDIANKRVAFLTIGEPGAGTPYRILDATFEIPGLTNVIIPLGHFPPVGRHHAKWLQVVFTSSDGTNLHFEIPGVPETVDNDNTDDSLLRTRSVAFESSSKEDTVKLLIPGPLSPKTDFEGLKFTLFHKSGKKMKYELKGFAFDDKKIKAENYGRGLGLTQIASLLPEGTTQNLFYHPGWKIQYQDITPNITFEHEDDIFYGLGNCPYSRVTVSNLRKATTEIEIVDFYMTVLRTECLIDKRQYVLSMLNDGHLEISGKFLRVPQNAEFILKPKLNHLEAQKLSSSIELEAVTRIFIEETTNPNKSPTNPIGTRISRSANFLTNLAISFLTKSRSTCRPHLIRLSRHLLATLKTGFMKLIQDKIGLDDCKECADDKTINFNDRLQIMGLIQFTIHGMAPVELGTMEVSAAFKHFFKINLEALKSRIK